MLIEKVKPMPTDPIPTLAVDAPNTLADMRPLTDRAKTRAGRVLEAASESVIVDEGTNLAADIVREKGHANSDKLAEAIDRWIDSLTSGTWAGRILKLVPIKRVLRGGINRLTDVIADWLYEFSDASEKKGS